MGKPFSETYLGRLRKQVGSQLLMVPGFRIILEDSAGRFLLLKRADNGFWGLPAGSPELGESIADCIRREVCEETGLALEDFECFGFASDPKFEMFTYPNGDRIQSYGLLVYSNRFSGQARVADEESTDVRFLAKEDFPPQHEILANELRSFEFLREYRRTGKFQWA